MSEASIRAKVGEKFLPYEKTFTSVDLFAYGAATWDWSKAHYDTTFAKSMKVDNVFVDGQQFGALFARRVMDRFGPKTFIARLKINYKTMVFVDETIVGEGEIVDVRPTEQGTTIIQVVQRFKKGDYIVSDCTIEAYLMD